MALVMALGIMMVLTITLTTVITLTAAGGRDAHLTNAEQKAHSLAEAGINNALAQLASHYPSSNKEGNLGGTLAGGPAPYDVGDVSWTGAFNAGESRWHLTGTGTVKNPTGAADVVRIATAKIRLTPVQPWAKFGIYASDPTAPCTTLGGGISTNVPVYVASCLETDGNSGVYPAKVWDPGYEASPVEAPSVFVHVGGGGAYRCKTSYVLCVDNDNGKIGTPAKRIKYVSAPSVSGSAHIHTLEYKSPPLGALDAAILDAQATYNLANWSAATCTTGTQPFETNNVRDNSRGTISNLFTVSNYDCTAKTGSGATVGRLAWDNTAKLLTIEGTIYLDGNLSMGSNDRLRYEGNGTLYVNGRVHLQGTICGKGSTFSLAGSLPSPNEYCSMAWDPALGNMMIVALNAAGSTVTAPLVFATPNENGTSNAWTTTPVGLQAWEAVDEWPTVAADDYVSTLGAGLEQDLVFPNTLIHDPAATSSYSLWFYGRSGNGVGSSSRISLDDTDPAAATDQPLFAAGSCPTAPCALGWRERPITITSQAELDGLRLRLVSSAGSPVAQFSAGPNYTGTGENFPDGGTTAWSSPANIQGDTPTTAATVSPGASGTSQMLRASNFGFAIPTGSTVVGVTAEIEREAADNNRHSELSVRLLVGGTETGANKSDGSNIPKAKGIKSYGGANDLWSASLTPANINASDFGLAFKIQRTGNATTTSVYRIRLTIHYEEPTVLTETQIHSVYLQQSAMTWSSLFSPIDAFKIDTAHARLEIATWTVGNFEMTGNGELGGSVINERGYASIRGGGLLKAFVTLPSGSPSLYGLAEQAEDFG